MWLSQLLWLFLRHGHAMTHLEALASHDLVAAQRLLAAAGPVRRRRVPHEDRAAVGAAHHVGAILREPRPDGHVPATSHGGKHDQALRTGALAYEVLMMSKD